MYYFFGNNNSYEKDKAEVISNIIPRLEKKIQELEIKEPNEDIIKSIQQKKIIIQCLMYYYSL
jgi:hypothetical protein